MRSVRRGSRPAACSGSIEGFEHPLVARYAQFLAANRIHIAGVEFIIDRTGTAYTYDVNTNTNYNSEAEAVVGRYGMRAVARYLGAELARVGPGQPVAAGAAAQGALRAEGA